MNITVISDFVCPYCYIAEHNLDSAVNELDYKDSIDISYQSFQLYPDLDENKPIGLFDMMKKIKNLSYEHVELLLSRLDEVAKALGLEINFDKVKYTNTFKTHRVFQHAKNQDKGNEFYSHIYEGFFRDCEIISDTDYLMGVANALGLDEKETFKIINDDEAYKEDVLKDIARSYAIEVYSVPFILADESYGIYGGRTSDSIAHLIDSVHDNSIEKETFNYKNPIKCIRKKEA